MKDHDLDAEEIELASARRRAALATLNYLCQDNTAFGKEVLQRLRKNAREYIAISKGERDIAAPDSIREQGDIVAEACIAVISGQLDVLRGYYSAACGNECIPELCSLLAEGV